MEQTEKPKPEKKIKGLNSEQIKEFVEQVPLGKTLKFFGRFMEIIKIDPENSRFMVECGRAEKGRRMTLQKAFKKGQVLEHDDIIFVVIGASSHRLTLSPVGFVAYETPEETPTDTE